MNITEILTDVEYNSEEQIIETKTGEAICLISFEVALWHNEVGTFIEQAIKEKVEREKAFKLIKTAEAQGTTVQITQLNNPIVP